MTSQKHEKYTNIRAKWEFFQLNFFLIKKCQFVEIKIFGEIMDLAKKCSWEKLLSPQLLGACTAVC